MMVVEREKFITRTGLKSNPKRCGIAINGLNLDLPSKGPSWQCCYELVVPDHWCDGLHIIKIENEDGKATLVPFWLTTPHEAEGVTICFSPINIQARNWWGGASATQVVNGKARRRQNHSTTKLVQKPCLLIGRCLTHEVEIFFVGLILWFDF